MKKKLAKEILTFWVSLLVMVVAYLVTYGVVEGFVHFKNKESRIKNLEVEKLKNAKMADIDSLQKVSQFISEPTKLNNREVYEKERKKNRFRLYF